LELLKEKEILEAETPSEEKGEAKLGSFLREQREKINLSHDQIAQKIRLRRTIIEAIEGEEWERLPPPVFVRGFLRSYAKILGLDENEVMKLYHQAAPPERDVLKPPLAYRRSSRAPVLIVLLILAAAACIFYFRHVRSSALDRHTRQSLSRIEPASLVPSGEEKLGNGQKPVASSLPVANSDSSKSEAPQPTPQKTAVPEGVFPPSEGVFPPSEGVSPPPEGVSPPPPAPEEETPWMVLKGTVKERTWVSIGLDGNEPKEFIFEKGAKPEWKAKKSFQIVIGNGAGMDFDLNGKRIENLGKPGEVVRLSLP
jgi:cytoskeleton protein RodZ